MFKIYLKLILFICIVLTPGIILSQHHLYFSIPECPNSVNIKESYSDDFTITPNPASNFLEISINTEINDNSVIRILDLSGKVILENKVATNNKNNHQILLDISKFEQGLYYVQFTDKNSIYSKKIIITQ